MARYMFQARNNAGQLQIGQMDAIDEGEVRSKLKSQGLAPLRVIVAPGSQSASLNNIFGFQKRVASKDLQIFTRQFSTLINAGITVVDSLKLLSEGKRDPLIKEAALKVRQAIESGKLLGDGMAQMPNVFDRFYVNMVRAGEEAGILDGILNRLALYLEKSEKLKKQVKGAMVYPVAIILVSVVVVSGILIFVIPRFQELYQGAGKELPFLTQIVVNASNFLIKRWYILIAACVGIPYGLMAWYQTREGRETCDKIFIRVPVFGELIQKSSVARLTRTLSTLLSSGVGVVEALDIASRTAGNKVIEDALARSKESVISGKTLSAPLQREPLIPDMVSQMIAIGESSGTLDIMLGKIADFYEDDVENAVKAVTSLMEPMLMVVLGGIIAVLVLAMYMPIFGMADVSTGKN
jgi:type IV pilus assembly protein PilC